jgi:hypothetical protein
MRPKLLHIETGPTSQERDYSSPFYTARLQAQPLEAIAIPELELYCYRRGGG